jgi:hypothetical protein
MLMSSKVNPTTLAYLSFADIIGQHPCGNQGLLVEKILSRQICALYSTVHLSTAHLQLTQPGQDVQESAGTYPQWPLMVNGLQQGSPPREGPEGFWCPFTPSSIFSFIDMHVWNINKSVAVIVCTTYE